MAQVDPISVQPRLTEDVWATLAPLFDLMGDGRPTSAAIVNLTERLSEQVSGENLTRVDFLTARLFLDVINDLATQGWSFRSAGDRSLQAYPPGSVNGLSQEQAEVKNRIRASLVAARDEQLADPHNAQFLREMERPRWHAGRQVAVQDLFTDPTALRNDLERRLAASPEKRDQLLRDSISPYLQLATADQDTHTGIRLLDIWRYCRYTWSLPFHSQPGRRMYYLIRDSARDYHPIIGIGALGNSMVQIRIRDELIGWTLRSIEEQDTTTRLLSLKTILDACHEDIYWSDLLTEEEIQNPTTKVLEKLKRIADATPRASRREASDVRDFDTLLDETLSPRFLRKRAVALRTALRARIVFDKATSRGDAEIDELLRTTPGRQAVKAALRIVKKRHVGTSIMDITTCGSLPPYSTLLGGKLASLLMASPRIVSDYREKYEGSASVIASRMKGSLVHRDPHLVMLATTSLYHVGSSQYNRLKAPCEHGDLVYRKVGLTEGFGSVHLSGRTYRHLQEFIREHPKVESHSNRFAAGVNYKIRSIASGLSMLGLNRLQRHRMPRIVYVIPLANNWREYLTDRTAEPDYIYDTYSEATRQTDWLTEYWKTRWYLPRVKREGILERLKGTGVGLLSRVILESDADRDPVANGGRGSNSQTGVAAFNPHKGKDAVTNSEKLSWKAFHELVGDRASFAERLTDKELAALHIETKIDGGLVRAVEAGHRIYLTGNPGDGKTHLIRRCERRLKGFNAFLHFDASAEDEAKLIAQLQDVVAEGRGAVIAINEGPLRKIVERLPEPDRSEVRDQVRRPFVYQDDIDPPELQALVVNLGTRQLLTSEVVGKVIDLALNGVDYSGAPQAVQANVHRLTSERVQERITSLLAHVGRGGVHFTMHELLAFFAFVLGGASARDMDDNKSRDFGDLVFSPANPLARGLARVDPADLSHPLVDRVLWDGDRDGAIEWLEGSTDRPPPRTMTDLTEALSTYSSLKRRYFLEASDGHTMLDMLPKYRGQFVDILAESQRAAATAKARLLEALSYFYGDPDAESSGAELEIWTGLRYDALGPPTAYVSGLSLKKNAFSLLLPRLRPQIGELIEYIPDHVRLTLTPFDRDIGLTLDLVVWLALMRIKKGMPQKFHDPVVGRRLEDFMSQVAASRTTHDDGYVRLKIRDVQSGTTETVDVSVEQRKYRL